MKTQCIENVRKYCHVFFVTQAECYCILPIVCLIFIANCLVLHFFFKTESFFCKRMHRVHSETFVLCLCYRN